MRKLTYGRECMMGGTAARRKDTGRGLTSRFSRASCSRPDAFFLFNAGIVAELLLGQSCTHNQAKQLRALLTELRRLCPQILPAKAFQT